MADAVLWIEQLPDNPLDAAANFYAKVLPGIQADFAKGLTRRNYTIVFQPAGHEHRAWRLAVVQELAREHAPSRVNALASDDEAAIRAALTYLDKAEGVTGQYLPLDGNGAVALLSQTDDQ